MTKIPPLHPDQLLRRCDPASFDFTTTAELEDLKDFLGQERAVDALDNIDDFPKPGEDQAVAGAQAEEPPASRR